MAEKEKSPFWRAFDAYGVSDKLDFLSEYPREVEVVNQLIEKRRAALNSAKENLELTEMTLAGRAAAESFAEAEAKGVKDNETKRQAKLAELKRTDAEYCTNSTARINAEADLKQEQGKAAALEAQFKAVELSLGTINVILKHLTAMLESETRAAKVLENHNANGGK